MLNFKHRIPITIVAGLLITVAIGGFVVGTAIQYQHNQISLRETFAYKNPVLLDLFKLAPDNSLIAEGWTYIGQTVSGLYHYQYTSRNHIMNAGQNWQNSYVLGSAGAGSLKYITLGTTAYGTQADASLAGGDQLSSFNLANRQVAQATNIGAAGSGSLTFTLIATFTADAAITGVDLAGLFAGTFNQANSPSLWAETTFAAVNANLNHVQFAAETWRAEILRNMQLLTLTITWTTHYRFHIVTSGGA